MKLWLAYGLCVGLLTVSADDETAKPKEKGSQGAMTRPKPAPEMKVLRGMVGTWNVQEMHEKSPYSPGGEGTGTEVVTAGPGGLSILINYRSKTGPMAGFRGMGIMSWDAEARVYRMAWADSMTPGLITEAGKKEGEDIVMNGEMTMNGKKYKGRDVISQITPSGMTITSEMAEGDEPLKKIMTLQFTKAESGAKPATAEKAPEAK